MKINKRALGVWCASMMLGLSSEAWAQKWLKSLDVGAVYTEGNASHSGGFGPHSGLHLGASGDGSFAASFIVPPEYTPGAPLYVGVFWHTDSAAPCGIRLAPNFLSVARIGRTHILGGGSVTQGFEPIDGSVVLTATATNTTGLKIYTITSPDPTTPLQPFDTINFGLFRPPDRKQRYVRRELDYPGARTGRLELMRARRYGARAEARAGRAQAARLTRCRDVA